MRKKALVIAAAAALMTLSTGITAFAAGWVKEDTTYGASGNMYMTMETGHLVTGSPIQTHSWFIILIQTDIA